MPTSGGGPVQYVEKQPCPPPEPQFALIIPAAVLEAASEAQRRRIGLVQLQFAHKVAAALAEAYHTVAEIVQEVPRD